MIIEIDTSVDSKEKLELVAKLLLDIVNSNSDSPNNTSLELSTTPSSDLESENINKIREFISNSSPELNITSNILDNLSDSNIDSKLYGTSDNMPSKSNIKDNPLSQMIPKDMADEIVSHTDDVLTDNIVNEPQESNMLEKISNPEVPSLPLNEPKFDLDNLYGSIAKLSKFYTPATMPSFKTKSSDFEVLGDDNQLNEVVIEEVYDLPEETSSSNSDSEDELSGYFNS